MLSIYGYSMIGYQWTCQISSVLPAAVASYSAESIVGITLDRDFVMQKIYALPTAVRRLAQVGVLVL